MVYSQVANGLYGVTNANITEEIPYKELGKNLSLFQDSPLPVKYSQ